MVAKPESIKTIVRRVDEIYKWIDSQISQNTEQIGVCNTCGDCCDFEAFGHRLFVTTPELVYLTAMLNVEKPETTASEKCPYNQNGKCSIHKYRFAGCRIFYCTGSEDLQSSITETSLAKVKSLCEELEISYNYRPLAAALNSFTPF
jgi:hypothetical protein